MNIYINFDKSIYGMQQLLNNIIFAFSYYGYTPSVHIEKEWPEYIDMFNIKNKFQKSVIAFNYSVKVELENADETDEEDVENINKIIQYLKPTDFYYG